MDTENEGSRWDITGKPGSLCIHKRKYEILPRPCFLCNRGERWDVRHKVGASVIAVRRSGGLTAFHDMNNFLTYAEMMLPTSNYWNVIHGTTPGEVVNDAEGVQIMEVLGRNMAYLMKLMEFGKDKVEVPEKTKKTYTNFIR